VSTAGRGEGGLSLPTPVFRPGTVGTTTSSGAQAQVTVDGDVAPVFAINITGGSIAAGTRVMVTFVPPAGIFITGSFAGTGSVPVGTIIAFGVTTAPETFLLCDGSAVDRDDYAALNDLMAIDSYPWGTGDGSTTFNVPDLRGRVGVGTGTGSGLTARALGGSGGEENHALSIGELANHVHAPRGTGTNFLQNGTADASANLQVGGTSYTQGTNTNGTGSGTAHNTMQPWKGVQYMIKALA
jgi:microcystin-dependent protein